MSDRATSTASLTFESLYGTHHGWLKSWLTRKLQSAFRHHWRPATERLFGRGMDAIPGRCGLPQAIAIAEQLPPAGPKSARRG